MRRKIGKISSIIILIFLLLTVLLFRYGRSFWFPAYLKIKGKRTVAEVLRLYWPTAEARLKARFGEANLDYPPEKVTFIAFKAQNILDVWASVKENRFTLVTSYKIKGASGKSGPKLREGDRQVPEGMYKIERFNPNSSYHLSMKLDYPNLFDLKHAEAEGRNNPGSNIFIHGKSVSVGCLAMGDKTIEELFILSHSVGLENITVIIAPTKLTDIKNRENILIDKPDWVIELYDDIQEELEKYYKNSSEKSIDKDFLPRVNEL